ncbi:MarR family winged helix-turn-helix transcriptional regulator [Monashia sp. NPDC004114]
MPTRPTPELGLLFDLLRANELMSAMLRHALSGTGITPAGYAVTSLVYALGTTTPTEIAEMIGSKPSTLTAHLATLVRDGVLSRTPGRDGRSVNLELTVDGRRMHEAAVREVRRVWRRVSRNVDIPHARKVVAEVIAALESGVDPS